MAANPKRLSKSSIRTRTPHGGLPSCKLAVRYVSVESLRLDPSNPRRHSKKQVRQIANSIRVFGFCVPILVNSELIVIAGHGRVLAAQLLGISEVPVIVLDHLSDKQRRALLIADNRLSENSTWDENLLREQLKLLSAVELDFSLEVLGFEVAEIDVMIEGLSPASAGEQDEADVLPDAADSPVVSKLGDLWLLGSHRVVCADALKEESYRQLMDTRRAAAVFTDPPYNDPIDGYVTGFGKIHHPEFKMASGDLNKPQFTEFLFQPFSHISEHSEEGSLHYIFMDWRHSEELLTAAKNVFAEFKALCVWDKGNGGQGSLYRSAHELVFVFKNGNGKHRNNVQLGQFGRYRTNVWRYPRVNSLSQKSEEGDLRTLHPTIKPVALVADAILDCTARNDIVLDPFLGSGTTVIAAERTGRICYGLEIEPKYVDTIVRRWQAFTGKTAVHKASGRAFTEIEAEVASV